MQSTIRLPAAAVAIAFTLTVPLALAGCAGSSGSGLLSSKPSSFAASGDSGRGREATVLGSRTALSDAREQRQAGAGKQPATATRSASPSPVADRPAATDGQRPKPAAVDGETRHREQRPPEQRPPEQRTAEQRTAEQRPPEQRTAEPRNVEARHGQTHQNVDTGRARALAEGRETPRPDTQRKPSAAAADGATVTVEPGDTLLKIATRHRVSVSALMSANRLASLTVEPGQRLVIPKR